MAPSKRRALHQNSNSMSYSTSGGVGGNNTLTGSPGSSFKSSKMNFRPSSGIQEDRGGTRPTTTTPSSIGLVLITMIIHICKKSLLFDAKLKVGIYLMTTFIVSLICDFVTMPKTYFSTSDNILNRVFVKWGWAWFLLVIIPWITLTAHTIACGKKNILLKHISRIIVATISWHLWTKTFQYIEKNYGRCNTKDLNLQTKSKCIQAGFFWSGFDISGHTFILIYISLILAEEASSFIGWESIKDFIIMEQHSRTIKEVSTSPLRNLSETQLNLLKKTHKTLTPYLRALFIAMTLQQLFWDVMLVSTMIYYHIMIEKFIGSVIAICTWYVTYHWLYKLSIIFINSPGDGLFEYNKNYKNKKNNVAAKTRRSTTTLIGNNTPTFMGMPIRTQQTQDSYDSQIIENDATTNR